jgi:hypothetical protein
VLEDSDDASTQLLLVKAPQQHTESLFAAQAEAEAAQQKLLTEGHLAKVAADNELLSSILRTYSTVQRLYHKALRPFLQEHTQYAASTAGVCTLVPTGVVICGAADLAWRFCRSHATHTRNIVVLAPLTAVAHRIQSLDWVTWLLNNPRFCTSITDR